MNPVSKCYDCDRWKINHEAAQTISDQDIVCSLCQATLLLEERNDYLEGVLVSIRRS